MKRGFRLFGMALAAMVGLVLVTTSALAGPTTTPTATPTATPIPMPPGISLINGGFETGDLTGWTLFTTVNGTIGARFFPFVVPFDTNNDGFATNSARFRVGDTLCCRWSLQGGGLFQQVELSSGDLTIEADIAAFAGVSSSNSYAGLFELLLDGVVVDSHDFGSIASSSTEYSMLHSLSKITAGAHEIRIRMRRPYVNRTDFTPRQVVDNVTISGTATEGAEIEIDIEPGTDRNVINPKSPGVIRWPSSAPAPSTWPT